MTNQITQWVVLAVGVLGTLYGLAQTSRAKPGGGTPRVALGFFIWPNSLSAVLVVLSIIAVLLSKGVPGQWLPGIIGALVVGWLLLFGVFQVSRSAGRKLAADIPVANAAEQLRIGYNLISASGFLSCSAALLGVSVFLFTIPSAKVEESLAVEILVTLALGVWVAVTYWSFPSALYRGLLSQETDSVPGDIGPLCVRFRSASGEMAFLSTVALVASVTMSIYHFGDKNPAGPTFPLAAFAASLILGILVNPLLLPSQFGSEKTIEIKPLQVFGVIGFVLGTGLVAYFLATSLLGDVRAFYTFGVGLVTAMLLILTARYRPPFVNLGTPFGIEIAIGQALMVLASELLAFRWLGGYGVALCTVGLFSCFAMLFPIGALWAIRHEESSTDSIDLPFLAHASSRFAEIVMAGGAFLLLVALVRLFNERASLGNAGIDIIAPYPLIGLVIGASFPILLRSISLSGQTTGRRAASFDQTVLTGLGRWAAFRTLGIWLLAAAVPMLVTFFWRMEAAGAFMVGLAAAELFLILTLWLGEVRNSADESVRFANRATHILVVGSALITVLLSPILINATDNITRAQKIWVFGGVFVVLFVWVSVVVMRRLRVAGGG